ncbi:MAG: hypothetical protein CM15mP62_10280 [Rhodospirillaceae bacterium]|nr:MAG: hypothetical protein CM15mP62_10280 [Rhodospirillaceae bacterium]
MNAINMMEKQDFLPDSFLAQWGRTSQKAPFKFTARMKGYTAVLGILISVLIGMLFCETMWRLQCCDYQNSVPTKEGGIISNIYTLK